MLVRIKISILTEISYYLVRIIGRTPNKIMIFILEIINKLMSNFKFEVVGFYIRDIINVYKMDKQYTDIVRNILTKSRKSEMKDLLRGIFEK